MIYRSDKGLTATSLDAPELQSLRVGIIAGTPPADLVVRYHLMEKARPYALTVDTRFESATHQLVTDVVNGETDLGLLWGPIAGYYLHRDHLPLTLVPLKSEPGSPRMDYHIAMGVRVNEPEWRRKINAVIQKQQPRITSILQDYGVPLLDERGEPIKPSN
jgi:ABC-type amino acid transport substrate-binding protein